MRYQAQVDAERKYSAKRKGKPQLSSVYIDEEEKKGIDRVFNKFNGNKKQATLEAFRLLAEKLGID
jgi:hypothetical protein